MGAFTALTIATIASAAGSAYGQIKAGGAEKRAGEREEAAAQDQANLLDWNAKVSELQAQDAIARGAEEESRFRMSVRQMLGAQRAGIAAGGVDVGFGSALDVQEDTAYLGELDALTIRTNAAREAWGFKIEAEDQRRQAGIVRKAGRYAAMAGRERRTQSYLGAANTVLGAGTSLVKQRYGFA